MAIKTSREQELKCSILLKMNYYEMEVEKGHCNALLPLSMMFSASLLKCSCSLLFLLSSLYDAYCKSAAITMALLYGMQKLSCF